MQWIRVREHSDIEYDKAEGIAKIRGLSADVERTQTNIVYFELASERVTAKMLVTQLSTRGIKLLSLGPNLLRAVTHYGISADEIDSTLTALREVMETA